MQTIIQGKEIETTYSVKTVRNENGVLIKKPELVKTSKVVRWDNLLNPIDGDIRLNNSPVSFNSHFCINISENETVSIEEEIYRADINKVMVHTDKVVREKEINKTEAEKELKVAMAEYNHLIIDNNSKMKAYCNVNKIDVDTVNNAINIVYGDDWCSLYLNDKLIDEGHELSLKSYLGIVRMYHINAEEIYHTKFQYLNQEGIEYTENRGCFPEKYENIKKYIDMEVSA